MKNTFQEFYTPSDDDFEKLWKKAIFVFDTNILLNLYRYSETTRNELFNFMKRFTKRIWIPHQVALEFHKNRINVILEKDNFYKDIKNLLENSMDNLKVSFGKFREKFKKHQHFNYDEILKDYETLNTKTIKDLQNNRDNHPDYLKDDTILKNISELFADKVGEAFEVDKLESIYKDGIKRYKEKIPPGYEDEIDKKGNSKFGDLILWRQILEKAKKNKTDVILLSDDRKGDWWNKVKNNTFGPRPDLLKEFNSETQQNIYMYQSERFMKYSEKYYKGIFDENSINEAREIRIQDESDHSQATPLQRKYLLIKELGSKIAKRLLINNNNKDMTAYELAAMRNYLTHKPLNNYNLFDNQFLEEAALENEKEYRMIFDNLSEHKINENYEIIDEKTEIDNDIQDDLKNPEKE